MTDARRSINVLLVEDNPADVALTAEILGGDGADVVLDIAADGVEALEHLEQCAADHLRMPDIIILDLNMPRMSGGEFLDDVRRDERFRAVPVIVLTTSAAERDVVDSYRRGANSFVTKPLELRAFMEVLQKLQSFWFSVARLPSEIGEDGRT